MKTPKALLLYEETNHSELLRAVLSGEGMQVEEAPLESGIHVAAEDYCVVVFDIVRLSGRTLERIREWRDSIPGSMLLVAGGRTAPANRIAVLETGIEAYLTKPVAVAELRARARAALRRFRSHEARLRQFTFGSGTVDLEARMIHGAAGDTRLTPTECGILEHLAQHMNHTVPSTDLVKTLW
ncbi:MAG: response regulator transcription factor, partial [Acidobacteriia bacterium]|nr:response regulator transcription factor [Terriglobia bacterium]MBV8906337.1 response regulator transcription factor [Terriglobia bacterium]